jgi:hypothetical protein
VIINCASARPSKEIARIPVTETGDYDVIRVVGVDASALAQGREAGREFVKVAPLADPYPNLTYTVSGVTVSVTALGSDYPVNATVPFINKVTVLKVGSAASDTAENTDITAGTAAFAGRVMILNLNCNDPYADIRIAGDDANNKLMRSFAKVSNHHPGDKNTFPAFPVCSPVGEPWKPNLLIAACSLPKYNSSGHHHAYIMNNNASRSNPCVSSDNAQIPP